MYQGENKERRIVYTGRMKNFWTSPFLLTKELPFDQNTPSIALVFDIMQSIIETLTSPFVQLLMLLSVTCVAILAAVGHGIYNRYFHPLRRLPGPIWASLTDLYKLHALWAKHIPTSQLALHKEYGMLFVF